MVVDPAALAASVPDKDFPDGIARRNIAGVKGFNPLLPLLLLAALMIAGLVGLLGGKPDMVRRVNADAAALTVRAPSVIRNGMFFETIVEVQAHRPVDDLVIAISAPLWRQMTINTMIPAASEESYSQGAQRFSFGKLEAGDSFRFKIDGQINPSLFAGTRGEIAVLDGDRRIVGTPVTMKVLP